MRGKPWLAREDGRLRMMAGLHSKEEIARKCNRTVSAVVGRACVLNLSLKLTGPKEARRMREKATATDIRRVKEAVKRLGTIKAAAEEMGIGWHRAQYLIKLGK